jgi:sulfate adenylyltransferase subunit 1 (EFTu-like GTPase family)
VNFKATMFAFLVGYSNLVFSQPNSPGFIMPVEYVAEPKGLVFNGTLLSGKVKSGCIAKGDAFKVTRNGNSLAEAIASIVDVPGKLGVRAKKGDSVRILIYGTKNLGIKRGDSVTSNNSSCQ